MYIKQQEKAIQNQDKNQSIENRNNIEITEMMELVDKALKHPL